MHRSLRILDHSVVASNGYTVATEMPNISATSCSLIRVMNLFASVVICAPELGQMTYTC